MTSLAEDLLDGLSSSVAVKGPCAVAATTNVVLAGEQTIDGVLTSASRVLVVGNTAPAENGIWVTSTGDWRRARDFSRNEDVVFGTAVRVPGGTNNNGIYTVQTATASINIDTLPMSITRDAGLTSGAQLATAIHAATGKAPMVAADEIGFWDSVSLGLRKLTFTQLVASLGAIIATMTAKATPVDADGLLISDSAAAGVSKLTTFTQAWANYFKVKADALYLTLAPTILLDLSSATAGRIKFPATQNPSADPNTLDDYEEGTFTPTIDGGSTVGVGTYSEQVGRYTKIGNRVFYSAEVTWSAHTGTGTMRISGLPFTVANGGNIAGALLYGDLTYTSPPMVEANSTAVFIFFAATTAARAQIPIDTAATLHVAGHYHT